MKTLIVVDVQNDFLPGGALAVPDGDAVIPVINRLMSGYDIIVATQDWHPANHVSFAANHPGKKAGDQVMLDGEPQMLWPAHCVQNSRGAAFAAALDMARIQHVVKKGTDPAVDSYSGFFDNNRKRQTDLADYLRGRGVTELDVVGLATDYCVRATACDARNLGFGVRCLLEGCRGVNFHADDVAQAIRQMKFKGVVVC